MKPRLIALVLLIPSASFAQSRDPGTADALYREGRAALKRGDFKTACPKFVESQRLEPAPSTLINIADCEARDGDLASAWSHLQEALRSLPADDERRAGAERRAAELERKLPRLLVRLPPGAPAGTSVRRDGVEIETASLGVAVPVSPGTHTLTVIAPGHRASRAAVEATPGTTTETVVRLGEIEENGAPAPDTSSRASGGPPPLTTTRTVGYVVGAAGVVTIGVAIAFAFKSRSDFGGADTDVASLGSTASVTEAASLRSDAAAKNAAGSSARTVAIVGGVVGGAGLIAGLAMVLLGGDADATTSRGVRPMVGSHVAGLSFEGDWR